MKLLRMGLAAAALLALLPAIVAAYSVSFDYYVYATSSDGIPITDDQTLQDQIYTDGVYTKTGDFGNYGTAWFRVDLMDKSVSATGHSHGLTFEPWPHSAVGTGRVEGADFYDRITFTAPEGTHPDGLYATLTGYVHGTLVSTVGAGAQCRCMAYFGPEIYDTGLLTTGVDEARTITVDDDFTLVIQIVPPGATLNHPTDYTHQVRLGFWNGIAWSVHYNTGSGYVSGDGDFDFLNGLRISGLSASDGVTWTSESGAFGSEPTAVPDAAVLQLHQNSPNPFNPRTAIAFSMSETAPVTLRIYDMAGRLVATLLDGTQYGPGRHETVWDGKDFTGRAAAAGTYFYRIDAAGSSEAKGMVLVR